MPAQVVGTGEGTVKFFNGQKGFGFIQREDGGPDAFVHISAVQRSGLNGLDEGQKVSYEIVKDLDIILSDPTLSLAERAAEIDRATQAAEARKQQADQLEREAPGLIAHGENILNRIKEANAPHKMLSSSDLRDYIVSTLVENFPDLFNVRFTANMESDLDRIESGQEEWVSIVRDFYQPFNETLDAATSRQQEIKDSITEKTDEVCENCGSPMVIKWGRNGRFLACSAYPECKTTRPLNGENEIVETDETCEKCGGKMVIREGRFGKFMACANYPKCKNTKALPNGITCPRENCGGQISERRTKRGKVFWGCSNYPKCDFASWYKPVNQECPACKNNYLVEKTSKVKGDYLYWPECKNKVHSEEE